MCGEINSLNYNPVYEKGGYFSISNNSLESLITQLLVSAGCRDVVTEPLLLPTARVTLPAGSNTADTARADVSAEIKWNLFGETILRRKSVPRSSPL